MKQFPYHDAAGLRYPELDTRTVSVLVMADYLGLSRWAVRDRAVAGVYGRTPAEGAWVAKRPGEKRARGLWAFRPALIWRRLGWGRFAQVGFDPRQLEGSGRVFCCDPAITAERIGKQVPAEIPAEFRGAFQHLAGAHLEVLSLMRRLVPDGTSVPFTLTTEHR